MILESFIAIGGATLATRALNFKIQDDMKEKILNEGLYHVTSKEAADSIVERGYMKTGGYISSYGRKKCYFFCWNTRL